VSFRRNRQILSPSARILLVPEDSLYIAFRLLPILHRAGFAVDILCLEGDPVAHSRYAATVIQQRTVDDQSDYLAAMLKRPQQPWRSVIVVNELLVRRLLAANDPALLERWQPAARDSLVREFYSSKSGLEPARQAWHLPIPFSQTCSTLDEILNFGAGAGWPLIVKPPVGSGGDGVIKFSSPQAAAAGVAKLCFPVVAQQFIHGRSGTTEMLCSAGRPLAWLASHVTKTDCGQFGPSTARLFAGLPRMQPLVEEVARHTRFDGFCGFDWVEEKNTGKYYLVEFHPRASQGFRYGRFCGVDFSQAVGAWLRGNTQNFAPLTQLPGTSVAAHAFTSDFFRCLRQRDWHGLKAWLPGSSACHDVFWDDTPLFTAWAMQRCWRLFKKCF